MTAGLVNQTGGRADPGSQARLRGNLVGFFRTA